MADQTSRPYGSSPARTGNGAAPQNAVDPLAELARLIGQTDPFGEYMRDKPRQAPAEPVRSFPDFPAPPRAPREPSREPSWEQARGFGQQPAPSVQPQYSYPEQGFAAETAAAGFDHAGQRYQSETSTPGYYDERSAHAGDDVYDDAPPVRRRIGILAIAAVFALAVLGTASAVGYRALFGSSGSTPPPVIKADTAPLKIAPAPTAEPASNKLITDRVGAAGERIVSREEQPIDLRDRAGTSAFPGVASAQTASVTPVSGVVGEPKKIRTIPIRPDQPQGAEPTPSATAASARTAPSRATAPARTGDNDDAAAAPVAPRQAAARSAPPSSNAPMSLNPDSAAAAPARSAAPMRTASAPAAAPAASAPSSGGYAVQVSSQRSEADAQASYRALQGKFPAQLGSRQALIRRADLGDKGVYYRAVVTVGNADEASQLCNALKAAGGQCIVQRN